MAAASQPISAAASSAADTARPQLLLAVAMMLEAVYDPAAVAVLASLRPGDMRSGGARVPGTSYELPADTAARAMRELAALRGGSADALFTQLAEADTTARLAALKGIQPPVLANLYPHCPPATDGSTLLGAMQRLYRAAEQVFTVTQLRRIDAQCQAWLANPASLDATPVQQFVARFVRNCP